MFQRNILVTHLSRQLRGFLQHLIGLVGQIGRASRHFRVSIHDSIQSSQDIPAIYTQLVKNKVRDVFAFLDHASQQMTCFDGLLTFFLRKQDDLYVRREEIHRQRAYSLAQWKKLLKESGFTFLHAYDQLSTEKVIKESFEEKIFVTAKKLGE